MPMTALREDLESLLRVRKLEHTVVDRPSSIVHRRDDPQLDDCRLDDRRLDDRRLTIDDGRSVPTGIADLDARLDSGLPRGHLSEIVGPRSSGRLAILVSALAGATKRGEAVALIDPLDMFDPVSAGASGIDFARLLWVRGEASTSARVSLSCEYGTLQKALDRAVKALNLVLQAGGFGLVVLDLGEIAPPIIKRLPYTTWLRLHRVIEGGETACVLIGSAPIARSAGGATVQLAHGTARVIRARKLESDRHVRVPLSAAAC